MMRFALHTTALLCAGLGSAGSLMAQQPAPRTAVAPAASQQDFARQVEQALTALRPSVQIAGRDYPPVALQTMLQREQVPAISIAIIRDHRIAWTGAYGMADPATGRRATPATLFQAASISKPVAATAALRMVERGRLALDRPVNEQLRSWRVPDTAIAAGEAVTLRRLLTHTAGLTVHGFGGYAPGVPVPSLRQVLDGAAPANSAPVLIDLQPGSRWRYSGGGFTVAQQLMTDVSGRPFPRLMDQLVLRPAGMTRSIYAQSLPAARIGAAALAHRGDGSGVPGGFHHYPELAAAGLWTTPSDLARWALALNASFNGRPGGLLRRETATAMLTAGMGDFGLGMPVSGEGEWLRYSHSGSNEGYRAYLLVHPRRGDGIVIMTNGDNGGKLFGPLNLAIGRVMGWPNGSPRVLTPLPLSAPELAGLLGRYQGGPISLEIAMQGDRIVATQAGSGSFELISTAPNVFVAPEIGVQLEVTRDPATGRVSSISAGGNTLSRVP